MYYKLLINTFTGELAKFIIYIVHITDDMCLKTHSIKICIFLEIFWQIFRQISMIN